MKYLKLPSELDELLTAYVNQVLEKPGKYITHTNINSVPDIEKSDIPGISDEFFIHNNIHTQSWGGKNLYTGLLNYYHDIAYPPMDISKQIISFLEASLSQQLIIPSGRFLYPVGGYMGWHTNSNCPGTRVYLTYSPQEMGSYFKYVDNKTGDIVTSWDYKGWTIRIFDIPHNSLEYLWHCVYAPNTQRISFGYIFK